MSVEEQTKKNSQHLSHSSNWKCLFDLLSSLRRWRTTTTFSNSASVATAGKLCIHYVYSWSCLFTLQDEWEGNVSSFGHEWWVVCYKLIKIRPHVLTICATTYVINDTDSMLYYDMPAEPFQRAWRMRISLPRSRRWSWRIWIRLVANLWSNWCVSLIFGIRKSSRRARCWPWPKISWTPPPFFLRPISKSQRSDSERPISKCQSSLVVAWDFKRRKFWKLKTMKSINPIISHISFRTIAGYQITSRFFLRANRR